MLQATYVRPDRVMRTSVLEPTAEGYQPVRAAQGVAAQFTRIYGPTLWGNNSGALGAAPCSCPAVPGMPTPALPRGAVMTSKGPMKPVGVRTAESKEEAVSAMAKTFARGQSVRMSDKYGRVIVAHPTGEQQKFPFWSRIINKARELAQKVMVRRGRTGPLWQKRPTTPKLPTQYAYRPPPPRPGAVPAAYGWAPPFNRPAQAAQKVLTPANRPPQSVYLPEQAGGRKVAPSGPNLTMKLINQGARGVPKMVGTRGQANAYDAFTRTGRYY